MIELYGTFAITLGINNEMDTELNMSPEGHLRRKKIQDKIEASKKQEQFRKAQIEKREGNNKVIKRDGFFTVKSCTLTQPTEE